MLPVNKFVIFPDANELEKKVDYRVWYETHPDYKGMPVSQLKKMFDFERGESVPDIAIVKIEGDLYEFDRAALEDEIMENEGITDRNDIVFE